MRLQSAIFDMDGTLLDSMPTWRELGPTFLKEAGISATPEQDLLLFVKPFRALRHHNTPNGLKCPALYAHSFPC